MVGEQKALNSGVVHRKDVFPVNKGKQVLHRENIYFPLVGEILPILH